MFLSIIIPAYNSENTIYRCLQSCINQDIEITDYEIIVIDDGSVDATANVCHDFEQRYANIRYYHQKNSGPAKARNRGVRIANGDYLWFVDSDDFIKENCLLDLRCVTEREHVDVISLNSFRVLNNKKHICPVEGGPKSCNRIVSGIKFLNEINGTSLYTWAFIYKLELIRDNAVLFNETMRMCEDALFNLKLLILSRTVLVHIEPIYFYCDSVNSLSSKLSSTQIDNVFQYLIFLKNCQEEYNLLEFANRVYSMLITHMFFVVARIRNKFEDDHLLDCVGHLGIQRLSLLNRKYLLACMFYNISPKLLLRVSKMYVRFEACKKNILAKP